jgi:DnaJ homolog subfamily C member 11
MRYSRILQLEVTYSERQLVKILNRSKWEHEVARVEDSVRSQGRLAIGVNATSLFDRQEHAISVPLRESFRDLNARFRGIRISSFTLRHSFQVLLIYFFPVMHGAISRGVQRVIDDKTKVRLTTRAVSGRSGASNLLGTVKHQYSPRLNFEVCISVINRCECI